MRCTSRRGCTENQAVIAGTAGGHGPIGRRSMRLHNFIGIMPSRPGIGAPISDAGEHVHSFGVQAIGLAKVDYGTRKRRLGGGRKAVLTQVKLLDLPQQGIPMDAQHSSCHRLIPMGFLEDATDILTLELLHRFTQIIPLLSQLLN
jgi:hypothetical protein